MTSCKWVCIEWDSNESKASYTSSLIRLLYYSYKIHSIDITITKTCQSVIWWSIIGTWEGLLFNELLLFLTRNFKIILIAVHLFKKKIKFALVYYLRMGSRRRAWGRCWPLGCFRNRRPPRGPARRLHPRSRARRTLRALCPRARSIVAHRHLWNKKWQFRFYREAASIVSLYKIYRYIYNPPVRRCVKKISPLPRLVTWVHRATRVTFLDTLTLSLSLFPTFNYPPLVCLDLSHTRHFAPTPINTLLVFVTLCFWRIAQSYYYFYLIWKVFFPPTIPIDCIRREKWVI